MIRISLTPSFVVEVEAQKMSLLSSVLYCISHPSFLFTYKNLHAARLASSESTNWNLKTTLRAKYWYVNAQTRCWAVFLPTARALIGYLEVTWLLKVKLFPAKIF